MTRALRRDQPDGVFHVTTRGVDGALIYRDDVDRLAFVRLLIESIDRHGWTCHAFCLMSTHYHLLVETARAALSAGLHRLNGVYAQRFNKRHGRRGHLFGDRFASWLVESEEHLQAACGYILANPVRAGLCAAPEDWPWSGAQSPASDAWRTYVR